MVALQILVLPVRVRVLPGQHTKTPSNYKLDGFFISLFRPRIIPVLHQHKNNPT